MMDKNGSGWCFGDTKSIAETAHSFKLDKELEIDAVRRIDASRMTTQRTIRAIGDKPNKKPRLMRRGLPNKNL